MRRLLFFLMAIAALVCGCDSKRDDSTPRGTPAPAPQVERGADSRGGSLRERQAAFLNRIRRSDPRFQTIERAVLNENNELALVLNRNVDMDSIPQLMRAMLAEMAKEFPGQDLTVIAYTPTQPPMKLGTARLDAQTRQMMYTPAQQQF